MNQTNTAVAAALCACLITSPLHALVLDMTGGTVTRLDATTPTTNNTSLWDNVDYYEENGFRLDFLPNFGSAGFSTNVGDYYAQQNDVMHIHWDSGDFGQVTAVEITRTDGGPFDFDSFLLTSNTDTGGSPASGFEQAFVQGFHNNVATGPAVQLPAEDWGFPGVAVALGNQFNVVDRVVFNVTNSVDCFGMDNFELTIVPEPASASLLVLAALGLQAVGRHAGRRRSSEREV